jgi:truncated hemoglobin YjbI
MVGQVEAAIARHRRCEHVFAVKNQHTKTEEILEAVFSVWSAPRLYSKDQREKLVSRRLESAVSSLELQMGSGSSWLRYLHY